MFRVELRMVEEQSWFPATELSLIAFKILVDRQTCMPISSIRASPTAPYTLFCVGGTVADIYSLPLPPNLRIGAIKQVSYTIVDGLTENLNFERRELGDWVEVWDIGQLGYKITGISTGWVDEQGLTLVLFLPEGLVAPITPESVLEQLGPDWQVTTVRDGAFSIENIVTEQTRGFYGGLEILKVNLKALVIPERRPTEEMVKQFEQALSDERDAYLWARAKRSLDRTFDASRIRGFDEVKVIEGGPYGFTGQVWEGFSGIPGYVVVRLPKWHGPGDFPHVTNGVLALPVSHIRKHLRIMDRVSPKANRAEVGYIMGWDAGNGCFMVANEVTEQIQFYEPSELTFA
ncbi:hypothetical protein NMY22_g11307 [Coprinellus aureogranulatus]|nr:hypothetical protein NMY22_g11307 [Coprinellus aureogranulatus]